MTNTTKENTMEKYGWAVFMTEFWGTTSGAQVRKVYDDAASLLGDYLVSLSSEKDLQCPGDSEDEYYLAGFMPQESFERIVAIVRAKGLRVKEANFDIPKQATNSVSDYLSWWNEDYKARMALYEAEEING